MDVDNVFHGGAGKSQWQARGDALEPADFNRSWGDDPPWSAVRAAMERLRALRRGREVAAFIDLHDPWYPNEEHVYLHREAEELGERFVSLLHGAIGAAGGGNAWSERCRRAWFRGGAREGQTQTEPARAQMAFCWAPAEGITHLSRGLAATLEIPHWRDSTGTPITATGLAGYGEGLGRALAALLSG